jgi:hypothetical protein
MELKTYVDMERGSYARATGRFVKNPNMIEAIPEMAAVAVTRSRCMSISLVNFGICRILFAYYPSCKHCMKCLGRSWDPIYSCIHRYRLFERLQMPSLVSSVLD